MSSRALERVFIGTIMLAVLFGGGAFVRQVAQYRGFSIAVLAAVAVALTYAFRRNFLRGGPRVRLQATRDAAFLAAIAAAIAFVAVPARWSLGASVVACEFGLVVELLSRVSPAPP